MKTLYFKITLTTFLLLAAIQFSQAQEKSSAHVGLFYPVSTHGTEAVNYTNSFSLHLLTGLSGGETGAAIYGLAGIVKGDVQGAQISGLWNNASGKVTGMQVAGLLNQSADATEGAQIAGISNINSGNSAFQASGIFNTAKLVTGAQIAGISNVANKIDGTQISGIASLSKSVKGVQVASVANVAEDVEGLQVAGLVNRAKKVKGMQIGLINIADSSDFTIGLINIVKTNGYRVGVSVDENLNSFLTLRSGGKKIYGIFGLGTNFHIDDIPYGFEGGLGLNLVESEHFRLDVEVINKYLTDFEGNDFSKSSIQLLPALKISQSIHLFAGPSISYMHANDLDKVDHSGLKIWDETWRGNYQALLLGFTAGINVKF